ncbi:MAG TPA: glycoside hydrolase family 172 protein [Candidatus Limnocylindrales bacterium]|nr:glycoside hydrolase family 172 protein [Candidatus Limnocylindrales bacterium]
MRSKPQWLPLARYLLRLLVLGVMWIEVDIFGQDLVLDQLPGARDFDAHRITSSDPKGGNEDWRYLEPGATLVLADIKGPGCIVHWRDNITSKETHHLQYHVLRMYWDGERQPSVEAPVGDFFGIGFGFTAKLNSALVSIDQQPGKATNAAAMGAARNCYFPMPFRKSARVTISNEGKERSQHWFEVNYRSYHKPPTKQLYFHAQYRQGTPPAQGPYLILDAQGRGHLIGCVLSVKNNEGGWWGEGDEMVFIDGKQEIQGTGSEDYFCESYGLRSGCFPYFGVPLLEEPFISAYRWHVPDPVPFRKSLRFLIEQGQGVPPFDSLNYYYSVAYWYQTEPHMQFPKLPGPSERVNWAPHVQDK